jgi:YD repeat-containing protein
VDGITEKVDADGTKTTFETAPDPRWGAQVPVIAVQTVTTPESKTSTVKRKDTVSLAVPRDPFTMTFLRTQFTETGGGTRNWEYSGGTVTETSAEGRTSTTKLDVYGRVTKQTLDSSVAALEYSYDEHGRPKTMKQGAESVTFTYDAHHRLATETDAGNNVTTYIYDDADRVAEKRLPGGRTYRYAWDDNGNLESMTTPRGKVHRFDFTAGGRAKDYTPAASDAKYARAFSSDRALERVGLPSGAARASGSRFRCWTIRPTRRGPSSSWPSGVSARAASTSRASTDRTEPATRRERSRRGCRSPAANSWPSSMRTSCRRRTSCGGPCRTSPIRGSASCRRGGAISTRGTRS